MRGRGRPRGSCDRRGRAYRVNGDALTFTLRSFGEQMRHVREEADVSADELAAATGLSKQTIFAYERAAIRPSLRSIVAIAMALRVPIDHLVPEC